jgi:hypothetical protein
MVGAEQPSVFAVVTKLCRKVCGVTSTKDLVNGTLPAA